MLLVVVLVVWASVPDVPEVALEDSALARRLSILSAPCAYRCREGSEIDRTVRAVSDKAVPKKATLVEIIPGQESGQLKKRLLWFLDLKG
jgi:hypothetical protein